MSHTQQPSLGDNAAVTHHDLVVAGQPACLEQQSSQATVSSALSLE